MVDPKLGKCMVQSNLKFDHNLIARPFKKLSTFIVVK
jgi:hypothetical protein